MLIAWIHNVAVFLQFASLKSRRTEEGEDTVDHEYVFMKIIWSVIYETKCRLYLERVVDSAAT